MREMKDSGIEWIGEIPKEWNVSTIKKEYIFQTGGTPKTEIEDYFKGENIWINISDMKSKILYDSIKHISNDAVKSTSMSISPKGSLLYAFKLSVGAVSFCGKDMYTNEAIATFLPCKNSLDYLYYIAPIFIIMNANENIYGAKLLNQQLIRNAKIIIPPLLEQQKISAYLDDKCTKIDTIIEKQQKIIEKLKEYKISLITETVTKGLNPDAKMKDSGVEWIGEIPENWEISKIKYSFKIISGATPKSDKMEYWNGEINWITPADFKTDDMYISNGRKSITKAGYDTCGTTLVPINSIIFSKRAPIGNVVISSEELCTNQGCLACVSKKEISIKYFYFTISVFTNEFNMYGAGTTFKEISTKDFSNFILPLPELNEQQEIADYLDKKCSAIDSAIEKKKALIEKLTEYKKSLIYEVVTGKKEV